MGLSWPLHSLGNIEYNPELLDRWETNELAEEWLERFPFLFDENDRPLAKEGHRTHFFEWLGAVVIHELTGYHALVEKYEFKNHLRKQRIIQELLPAPVLEIVNASGRPAQCPDLLMFAPDHSDWFFCEVKGPSDRMRPPQLEVFTELAIASSRPVALLEFRPLSWAT